MGRVLLGRVAWPGARHRAAAPVMKDQNWGPLSIWLVCRCALCGRIGVRDVERIERCTREGATMRSWTCSGP
ncbi:MAG: hypothetical protein ABSB24_13890 [Gaiellaceae bacterium]